MRVKYDIDMGKITSMIEYLGGANKIFESEFEVVWVGYIIKYNLIDYLLLFDEHEHEFDLLKLKGFDEFYGDTPTDKRLTKEAIHWLQIGTDFMLNNYREYTTQKFLQGGRLSLWEKENEVMRQYVIDNREEFPDAYLEVLL